MTIQHNENTATNPQSDYCLKTAVGMLVNIVETACEHESDLELMRLVNFMDLYRTYLAQTQRPDVSRKLAVISGGDDDDTSTIETLENTECASFEYFISNSRLLQFAAEAASRECGVVVAVPPPLKLSANSSIA